MQHTVASQLGLLAFEVVMEVSQELMAERFVERNMDVPVPQIIQEIVGAEASFAYSRSPTSKNSKKAGHENAADAGLCLLLSRSDNCR